MQKILTGIEHFKELYKSIHPKSILLVCDQSFRHLPESVKNVYYNHSEVITVFDGFTPNPLYEQVCDGVELFRQNHCDTIIAIGGGSCIDIAKCIKLFCTNDPNKNYLRQEYKNNTVAFIAIPTTAGTGSESTGFAVIYYKGEKQSVKHQTIVPDYVILEASVLKTLPLKQKKATMLDALCQGIESWWSVNANNESKKYSKMAVETIVSNFKPYIYENNQEAAKKIMFAANAAGKAIHISQTTAAHAMSYKLTSLYQLPHGHAVALCLPVVWEYMVNHLSKCVDSRGPEYLKKLFMEIPVDVGWFNSLLDELKMEKPISLNRDFDIEILTQSVNQERLKNNPVEITSDALRKMYERIVI